MERFCMMFIIFFTLLPTYMCQDCRAGSSWNSEQNRCQDCQRGTFRNYDMQSCSPCLAGSYAPFEGNTECIYCNPGTYIPNSGSSSPCMNCPANTYSATTMGATSCTPCPNGLLTDARSGYSSDCTAQCPAGMYGVERCESCPVGTYNRWTKQRNLYNCSPCGDGFTSPLRSTGSDQCKSNCPAGHYGSVWSQPDYYGSSSSVACIPCPVGTYNSEIGQTGVSACKPCDLGTYSDSMGDSVCKECLRDKYCKQGISYDCNSDRVSDVSSQESSDCTCKPGFFDPTKIGL
jgi:hypothetical protein